MTGLLRLQIFKIDLNLIAIASYIINSTLPPVLNSLPPTIIFTCYPPLYVICGILWQVGPNFDFMPPNQTLAEGNDDQAFWALMAMTAAERNFQNPPDSQPGWVDMADEVFNQQVSRWDSTTCDGGIRWQIYRFNKGWNYKNSITQGCLFQLAARLALYTKNDTYSVWALKIWEWTLAKNLITDRWDVYDGIGTPNCDDASRIEWTYNNAVFLAGVGYLYNYTNGAQKWKIAVDNLLNAGLSKFFTQDKIIFEPACELIKTCNIDQFSFKGYLAEWLGYLALVVPTTAQTMLPYLQASAAAAARSCIGQPSGILCGMQWTIGGWDGLSGVGQQISAMNSILPQLAITENKAPPLNQRNGGSWPNPFGIDSSGKNFSNGKQQVD